MPEPLAIGPSILVFTPEFTYSIGVNGNTDFIATHTDGRRYHLDKDDLNDTVNDFNSGECTAFFEENAVENETDAMCFGFYSEWQDGLMDHKLVQLG